MTQAWTRGGPGRRSRAGTTAPLAVPRRLLAESGFDPAYGARPLKRALQRLVLDPLAARMLDGQLPEGGSIRVDTVGGDLSFEMSQPVAVSGAADGSTQAALATA